MSQPEPAIAVIGGSGLYQMDGFEITQNIQISTPFGEPSEEFIGGKIEGKQVWFLPRHGKHHQLLPHEINHRANFWALKSLGVKFVICVTAVGSLKEEYAPRHVVLPDQYFDRTSHRNEHTFFGEGIAAHVSFGQPVSESLRTILAETSAESGLVTHNGGTYVNMDGPAFSTKAESEANRRLGFDVIGMTNLAEAKLAREAEMALATLSMVTDYDCWKDDEEDVSVETVIGHLQANAKKAQEVVKKSIEKIDLNSHWPEHDSLATALITPKDFWPENTVAKLRPIVEKYI